MTRRYWLIVISVVAHLGIGIGVFATGVWDIERLDSDFKLAGIAVMSPPAPPAGAPASAHPKNITPKPKRVIPKEVTQRPVVPPVREEVTTTPANTTSTGTGTGPGTGDIDGPGELDDTGTCANPPCGDSPETKAEPPKPLPCPQDPTRCPATMIAPTVLKSLRISGETQIHPPDVTKTQMLRDGRDRIAGVLKVCIAKSGAISSVSVIKTTKYPAYDARLLEAARHWRYRPHTIDGAPVPACGMVSFIYAIK